MPVEALLLPLRMPLFCSFEIIALVGCGITGIPFLYVNRSGISACSISAFCLSLQTRVYQILHRLLYVLIITAIEKNAVNISAAGIEYSTPSSP